MQINLTIPRPHEGRTMGGQARILRERRRFNVIDCGRRFGKTDLCQILIHEPLLNGFPVGWFAPSYKILSDAWSEIIRTYTPVIKRVNNTDKIAEFITGGTLEAWTLDKPGAARSRKYKRVVIDEASRVRNLLDIFNYDIRPTLLDFQGDAYFPSTPKGLNDYYKLWMMAEDDPEWARWRMPTSENPYIALDEIASMRAAMPSNVARQELDAEFLEDGSFFQGIEKACTVEGKDTPDNHVNHRIVAGLDWALSNDFTVLRIGCATCGRTVDGLRVNKQDFTVQRLAIHDKLRTWGAPVLPERNSIGEPNIEILLQMGVRVLAGPDGLLGFNTSATTKPELIHSLAVTIEKQSFLFFTEDADELRSYEVQFTSGGHPKFSAPDGMNDDRVIADALMCWAAMGAIPLPNIQPDQKSKWLEATPRGDDNETEQKSWVRRY